MSPRRTRLTVGSDMDRYIGTRIRSRRQQLAMSMASLATQLEVLRQTVEKWEKGVARLSAGQLYEVANVLGVHPGWFYDDHPRGISQFRPEELDMVFQIPDAVPLLLNYARLNPDERAAVMVLAHSAGRDREPSIDGRGKAFDALAEPEDDGLEGDEAGDDEAAAP